VGAAVVTISCEGERCTLEGPVTMENVTVVLAAARELFRTPRVVVDLKAVTDVDSAAVSLLLEWRRAAARDKRRIEFENVPANLKSLAELYGVAHLIAIAG
jgi:phospholipid transport system transporter-binding protein